MDANVNLSIPDGTSTEFIRIPTLSQQKVAREKSIAFDFLSRSIDCLHILKAELAVLNIGHGHIGDLEGLHRINLPALRNSRAKFTDLFEQNNWVLIPSL